MTAASGSVPVGRRTGEAAGAVIALAVLAVAAFFTLHYAINADNAAMLGFARRMLAGGRLGVDFEDMNPPLSVIVYLPAAALAAAGVPGWDALNIYIVLLIALSAGLAGAILTRLGIFRRTEVAAILYAYVLANFLVPGISFGERDQIVLLGLAPLLLVQAALNEGKVPPRALAVAGLAFGALAICLKPHYALAPAAMILWRLLRERRLAALLRADVIVLGAGVAIYAGLLATVFSTYVRTVMPDVIAFYAGHVAVPSFPDWWPALAVIAVAAGACHSGDRARRIYLALVLGAAAGYGAYLLQAKGYPYHLIPCGVLAFVAACAMAGDRLRRPAAVAAGGALLLAALYPVHPHYPTHRAYPGLPLAQIVRRECGAAPCNFVVDNEFQFMTDETALYTGAFSASRFPAFWFESALACGQQPALFDKYADMVAADLRRWKPVFVAAIQGPAHCPGGGTAPFDFVDFYSRDPAFAAEWRQYKFERLDSFDRRVYFRGTSADYDHTMTFAIYRRTEKGNEEP